jgi:tetratricopeptide (TPR) repeat protein
MEGYIDLKRLNLEELVGVVNLYPWFGGARKELCARMSRMGEGMSEAQYADAAMYVASRDKIASLKKSSAGADLTDGDVEALLKSYISEAPVQAGKPEEPKPAAERKVYVVGGDFFSQSEYDKVRQADDNVFSRYAAKARAEASYQMPESEREISFYTETLAQIYAEQGYYEQSKDIYSKLILAYPEKSAYFAALIQEIDKINS